MLPLRPGVLAPSVLTGLECTLRQGRIREREGRVADRDGMKLVKRWLIAAWMVPTASFNPGIFQSKCQVIRVFDDRLRFVWARVAQDIPF